MRLLTAALFASLSGVVCSCGGDAPTAPASELLNITGNVWETSAEGTRLATPLLLIRLQYQRPGEVQWMGVSFTNVARFDVPPMPRGTALMVHAAGSGGRSQLCAVHTRVTGALELSVELLHRGSQPLNVMSPILSGSVYEDSPGGPIPASGFEITYSNPCAGLTLVNGWTDEQGRYSFCNLPRGKGCVTVFEPTADWDSYGKSVSVVVDGDRSLDIEYRR